LIERSYLPLIQSVFLPVFLSGRVVSNILLLGMLWVRPHGLFGERPATRV